jgi:myo-inositol-1(or 4)-monophosphatase
VLSGWPARLLPWQQYRALGCASLSLCALAAGGVDGYIDGGPWHAPWDYLGGLLICREAGASVVDVDGQELVTPALSARRQMLGAGTPELLQSLRSSAGRR